MKHLRIFLCLVNLFYAISVNAGVPEKPRLQSLVKNANSVCKVVMSFDIEVVDLIKNSTATFNFRDATNGSCVAVYFGNKKKIITAAHVVNLFPEWIANLLLKKLQIQNSKGPFSFKVNKISAAGNVYFKNNPTKAIPVLLENVDTDFDLAALKPADPKIWKKIKAVPIGEETLEIADPVFTIGNPRNILNLDFIFMSGRISNFLTYNKISHILTSPMIDIGNSGGPLFDENGHCIGIAVRMASGNNLLFSIFVHRDALIAYLKKINKK